MKFTLDFRVHATASLSTDCFGRLSRDRAVGTINNGWEGRQHGAGSLFEAPFGELPCLLVASVYKLGTGTCIQQS